MTPDKEKYLFDTYPIFDKNHERFSTGFNCEDGWFNIVEGLGRRLTLVVKVDELKVIGIKEKFGGLVIDVEYHDDNWSDQNIDSILRVFYDSSLYTCERCGADKKSTEDHCKPMNALHPRPRK